MATDFPISDVVNVIIASGDRPFNTADFSSVLLIAPHFYSPINNPLYADAIEEVHSMDDVEALGFITGSPVHDMCSLMFGGTFPPNKVLIKRGGLVSNTFIFNINPFNSTVYTINIKVTTNAGTVLSVPISVTSPTSGSTATSIALQLATAIEANSTINSYVAAAGVGTDLQISPSASSSFSLGVFPVCIGVGTGNISWLGGTNGSPVSDYYTQAKDKRDDFFFVLSAYRSSTETVALASVVETDSKMFISSNTSASVITSSTTDVAYLLKAANYSKTMFIQNSNFRNPQTTFYPDAALIGEWATTTPGKNPLQGKTLKGILVNAITPTELNYAKSKNANVYINRGGLSWFEDGKMASGSYADVVRGSIWLEKTLEEDIFAFMKRKADMNQKIPYTNAGIQLVVGVMSQRLRIAVENDFLSSFKIIPPVIEDISMQDKANRILPDIPFEARLSGALSHIVIRGSLQV